MGQPTVSTMEFEPFPADEEGPLRGIAVDMGNPHIVLFREADKGLEPAERHRRLVALGEALNDDHPAFLEGVNVEWAVRREWGIETWVYERGVGLTKACGTGACAVAAASWLDAGAPKQATTVALPGGRLEISSGPTGVLMKGEAEAIGEVKWPLTWED